MTSHIQEIPIPKATHEALSLLKKERDALKEENAHYRNVLATIEKGTDINSVFQDETLVLVCINSLAHRALQWTGPRKRTWRDKLTAWLDTMRAK